MSQEGKRWEIIWPSSAQRQFRKLPRHVQADIKRKLEWLREHVSEVAHQRLKAIPAYSLHIGQYRVLYELDWERRRIVIVRVGPHNEAYRG